MQLHCQVLQLQFLNLGKTFHRQFGIPIPCHSDSSSSIKLGSRDAQLIIEAALIMVDESINDELEALELTWQIPQNFDEQGSIHGWKVCYSYG